MGGTPSDMQARLGAHGDQATEPEVADEVKPARKPAIDPVDSILRGIGGAKTGEEAVERMLALGIAEDQGLSIRYNLQRPLEPMPAGPDGKRRTDKYEGVTAVIFTKKPYAKQIVQCLQTGEGTEHAVAMSHILAFSGISQEMAARLDGDDFRLMSCVAGMSYQGNHKSSTGSTVH